MSGAGGGGGAQPSGGDTGGRGEGPLGPDDPGGPNAEWFREGRVDPRKFESYLFDPNHVANRGKAEGWRRIFGLGPGDAATAERLIKEQLDQGTPQERARAAGTRMFELVIPRFEGPNGNVAQVVTVWGLDPEEERPHLVTAYPRTP